MGWKEESRKEIEGEKKKKGGGKDRRNRESKRREKKMTVRGWEDSNRTGMSVEDTWGTC